MDLNFTRKIKSIEEYSLSLIDLFEELPDSVFDNERLSPSKQIVCNVLKQLKGMDSIPKDDSKIHQYRMN